MRNKITAISQKTVICLILFGLIFQMIPIQVLALLFEEKMTEITEIAREIVEEIKEPKVIGEIEEKRSDYEKHYLMSDGTISANIYADAVHYKENGKYVEYDNTLIEKNGIYTTKSNDIDIKFSKNITDNETLTITNKGYVLNWSMVDTKISAGKVTNPSKSDLKKMEVNSIKSDITYKNILKDIDLRYDIISNKVEEFIVINNKEALQYEFVYNVDIDGLTVKQISDNELVFVDAKGNEIFYIEAPLMYDAESEYSDGLKLIPTKTKIGYTIKMELDKKWLDDEARVYPIVVDPTITTSKVNKDIKDTYIYNGDAGNTTKGTAHILRVGNTNAASSSKRPFRSLIQFSLPTLSSGDQVVSATLNLYNYDLSENPSGTIQFDIHAVTQGWSETAAYWSTMNTKYNPEIIDYIKYSYSSSNPKQKYTANITSIVKEWYTGGNNYGIMLKEHIEANNSTRGDASFVSSDVSTAYNSYKPSITIVYRNQTGLEDYLTTHTQNLGRLKTYTNDYNGNLTLIHLDAITPGKKFPINIYHVYNTNDRTVDIGYGNGYRLNLNQTLEAETIGTISYIKYIDEDGTRHYFKKNGTIWEAEDGLDLTITESTANYILEDIDGKISTFIKPTTGIGKKGYLKYIDDKDGNRITINYNTSNYNQITSVVDAASDTLTLTFTSNLLTSITDTANRTTNYTYTTKNLTGITYPDNETTTITYNANNLVTKIKNIDNYYIDYEYYGASPFRVKSAKEYSSTGVLGNGYNIAYRHNTTEFTDAVGNTIVYSFNNAGHTISISDFGEDNSVSDAYGISYEYGTTGANTNKLLIGMPLTKSTNNYLINSRGESNLTNWTVTSGITINTVEKIIGNKSFKLDSLSSSGEVSMIQTVPLTAGKTYTLSAHIKGLITTNNSSSGVFFYYEYKNAAGTVQKEYIKADVSSDWDRCSGTFTLPAGSSVFKVGIVLKNTVGAIYTSNIQLEDGKVANIYNLIENGAFNNGSTNWVGTNLVASDKVVTKDGTSAFVITGELKGKNIGQYTYLPIQKGDTFNLSFWAKNMGVPIDTTKQARVVFEFIEANGTIAQKTEFHVSPDSKSWQFISGEMIADKSYVAVKITPTFNQNAGNIYYTNIGLLKSEIEEEAPNITESEEEIDENIYTEIAVEYSADENYQTKDIDELGNGTTYVYNVDRGTIASITDTNGNTISYTYDLMDRLTSKSSGSTNVMYNYNKDFLSSVGYNGFNYNFSYDNFGNLANIKAGNQSLKSFVYAPNNGYLITDVFGNGQEINYTYDKFDRVATKTNSTGIANYTYDNNNNLVSKDYNGISTNYSYDILGRLLTLKENDNYRINYTYASNDALKRKSYVLGTTSKTKSYSYNQNGNLSGINDFTYEYDGLNRLLTKKINNNYQITYDYSSITNEKKTNLIDTVNNNGKVYKYEYDNIGNVTRVLLNNTEINKYYYDSLNQLVKEDNGLLNKTYEYKYDNYGNITSKKEYQYKTSTLITTMNYTYGNANWKDQLTSFDGKTITYDQIGNPLTYGSNITMAWQNGRELATYSDTSNSLNINYKYNDYGIRTEKTVNGITTKYYLEESSIVFEDRNGTLVYYFYDDSGVAGFEYQGNTYYYVKSLQGDIIEIVNSNYQIVASYKYDAWGNVTTTNLTSANIGDINPFRYRGYYYDSETNLYYLNSRYYNPKCGRFINADEPELLVAMTGEILETNLYTYCQNNPIMYVDSFGYKKKKQSFLKKVGKGITDVVKKGLQVVVRGGANIVFGQNEKRLDLAGFTRDKYGIYHAKQNAKQAIAGYNDLFDWAFSIGTDMKKDKFIFTYNNKDYVFWAWKGDYLNLGAGAELGIYERLVITKLGIKTEHWSSRTNLKMGKKLELYYNGKKIIDYNAPSLEWWLTGFNPKYQRVKSANLKAVFTVDFSKNTSMYTSFYNAHKDRKQWNFKVQHKPILTF